MKNGGYISEMKRWILLILIATFSFWLFNNFSEFVLLIKNIISVFLPFILGGVLAFILNIPMTKMEKFLSKKIKGKRAGGIIRISSIIAALMLFLLILLFVAFLLIPELIENLELLVSNIPLIIDKAEVLALDLLSRYPDIQKSIEGMFLEGGKLSSIISTMLDRVVDGAIMFVSSFVSSFVTFFMGIIFSIYMLCQKEYLIKSFKKLVYAFIKEDKADRIFDILKLSNVTFSKFISGQCVEAVILGSIMFVFCLLFRFPYALIISVLTTITALIPIFGALIAMVIGAILIAITNPLQAVVFIVVFQVVQQIEGNFIYPRVVGKSVGLSPLWTLLSITVFGSWFGVVGMLLGLPFASVFAAVFKNVVNNRLKDKKIKIV